VSHFPLHFELFTNILFSFFSSIYFRPSKLGTRYPKHDKESITNECPMLSLFDGGLIIPCRWYDNDKWQQITFKNKRASRYHGPQRLMRFTAIAFLSNYRLNKNITTTPTCVMWRDACRRFYLFISPTHAHVRARYMYIFSWSHKYIIQIFVYASAKNKNWLPNLSISHFIKFVRKLWENSAWFLLRRNTCSMLGIIKESQDHLYNKL